MTRAKLHVVTPLADETSSTVPEAESTRRPAVKPPKNPGAKRKSTPAAANGTVGELMTKSVICCRPDDTLNVVAQLMWDNNVGLVVVVNDANRPLSVVTDRDIAMAAYTQGLPLGAIHVHTCMASSLQTCQATDTPSHALQAMQTHRVRRLPIVDSDGTLKGLVGLTDLMRAAGKKKAKVGVTGSQVVNTLSGILI